MYLHITVRTSAAARFTLSEKFRGPMFSFTSTFDIRCSIFDIRCSPFESALGKPSG